MKGTLLRVVLGGVQLGEGWHCVSHCMFVIINLRYSLSEMVEVEKDQKTRRLPAKSSIGVAVTHYSRAIRVAASRMNLRDFNHPR